MDQGAQDRFAWRMFLGLVQCIFAIRTVHNFITPDPLLSTELCFAAFLITFFTMVIELNNHPTRRSFRVQATTEDAEGRWSVTLERERRERETIEEMGYGPRPLDHNGNRLLALSNQERVAIEAEAQLILDELAIQNGTLTAAQQTSLERSIARCYQTRQRIAPSMRQTIEELALWQQGLQAPVSAPPPYRALPMHRNPFRGTGGEVSLMFTPFRGSELQLVPRENRSSDDIVQSLPSPSRTSGEFIGLTDASDRHYPIHFQVNHPFEAPPSYIDSTVQQNDVDANLHPFRREVGIHQHRAGPSVSDGASQERVPGNIPSSSPFRRENRPQLRIRIPEQQNTELSDFIYSDAFPGSRSGTSPATPTGQRLFTSRSGNTPATPADESFPRAI